MSNIEFEDIHIDTGNKNLMENEGYWFIKLIMKTGVVQNKDQAYYIALGFALIGIVAAIILFASSGPNVKPVKHPVDYFKVNTSTAK